MYCPKCTLEIKGNDQKTCPICNTPLTETPAETADVLSEEELKLQELIADIDDKVAGSDESESPEIPEFQIDAPETDNLKTETDINLADPEISPQEPDFKLELDSAPEAKRPEPETLDMDTPSAPAEEASEPQFHLEPEEDSADTTPIDFKHDPEPPRKQEDFSLSLDADEPDTPTLPDDDPPVSLNAESDNESFANEQDLKAGTDPENTFDLEKELDLSDAPEQTTPSAATSPQPSDEAPTIDFDNLPIKEEASSPDAQTDLPPLQQTDTDSADPGEMLNKTLDELDPIAEVDELKKKSIGKPLLISALILALVIIGAFAYLKLSPREESQSASTTVQKTPVSKTPIKKQARTEKTLKTPEIKKPEIVKKTPPPVPDTQSAPPEKITPPVKEKPAATAPVVQKTIPPVETYSIHAGSFRKKSLAQTEIERFGKNGFNGYIERVNLGEKGVWYRVKIGLYENRSAAERAEKAFLRKIKAQTRIVKNK